MQLLHSHSGREGDENVQVCKPGERGLISMRMFVYKFLKGLSRPSKRKTNTEMDRNYGSEWRKIRNSTKTITELKGTVAKFQ